MLFAFFSLPNSLECAIKLGGLIPHLEILDLELELLSPVLILDLLKPLPRFAEILLSEELLSFLLDNDSIDVS